MTHNATMDTNLQDVTPEMATRLVIMLYDGAIASLQQALEAIETGDLEGRCRSVNLAVDILANLSLALDIERGGEVADNLSKLYGFMISRLQRVSLLNDPQPARDVIKLLEILHESWCELDRRVTEERFMPHADDQHGKVAAQAVG
jgi:flagellar protein FliS